MSAPRHPLAAPVVNAVVLRVTDRLATPQQRLQAVGDAQDDGVDDGRGEWVAGC